MSIHYLIDYECPKCRNIDENVKIPEKTYREALDKYDGWIWHTCTKCGCEFKQRE